MVKFRSSLCLGLLLSSFAVDRLLGGSKSIRCWLKWLKVYSMLIANATILDMFTGLCNLFVMLRRLSPTSRRRESEDRTPFPTLSWQ
ncbi:unnamed protein product, partial [Mesorhabditis belari]|uniref:Uncharacterized protein n=1 Tax=Mesorhabditis belari TaxID=2138241 RepID=A0AAF3F7L6_9BILA